MRPLLGRIADHTDPGSLAARLRRARMARFVQLVESAPGRGVLRVLDVGGDPGYWPRVMEGLRRPIEIVLVNLTVHEDPGDPRIRAVVGDARDLRGLADRSFDVAYSNSVIEHVGLLADQARMASEIRRVADAYFVQTPNRYFPLESHFLLPYVQFLPPPLRAWLARTLRPGWYRSYDPTEAAEEARRIRLLTAAELRRLFPDGRIWGERVLRLTKSWVVWRGFSDRS